MNDLKVWRLPPFPSTYGVTRDLTLACTLSVLVAGCRDGTEQARLRAPD
jgi:hypothetical protein